jgi:amicoumacin kinase
MKSLILNRFTNSILEDIVGRYSIAQESLLTSLGFMNIIYNCIKNDKDVILRISHSSRRSVNQIEAEVSWIRFLEDHGMSVCNALLSKNTNVVECISGAEDGFFHATLFRKADGRHPNIEMLNSSFFNLYGSYIGKMHNLSKSYSKSLTKIDRPHWNDSSLSEIFNRLPQSETIIVEKCLRLFDYIKTLQVETDSYGLVHQDAHISNLFVDDNGAITLFDFDDCCYSWYINDLAIIFFYASLWYPENIIRFIESFLKPFLDGYLRETDLNPIWYNEIPCFLKARELDIYSLLYDNKNSNLIGGFIKGRKKKIEEDVPFLEIDFLSVMK